MAVPRAGAAGEVTDQSHHRQLILARALKLAATPDSKLQGQRKLTLAVAAGLMGSKG